jgi:hypothetical protein
MTAKAARDVPEEEESGIAPPSHKATPGDPFEALFMAEYGRVVAIANRVLADRGEAEDVAQEVFIDFHRRHRADAPFAGGWLHQAAVHTALNRIRGRKRRQQRELKQALADRPAARRPGRPGRDRRAAADRALSAGPAQAEDRGRPRPALFGSQLRRGGRRPQGRDRPGRHPAPPR